MAATTMTAMLAATFIGSLGINTHVDYTTGPYSNRTNTKNAINYLGVKNLRDSPESSRAYTIWPEIAKATGAKFIAYMPRSSPTGMQNALNRVPTLKKAGVLNYIEGANEPETSPALALGNSLSYSASFQQKVFNMGRAQGLKVINLSVGGGWTHLDGWKGNYDSIGNLSPYADFANAHTYPTIASGMPYKTVSRINDLSLLSCPNKRVFITELGWNHGSNSQTVVAKHLLNGVMDAALLKNAKTYIFALFDDASGKWGIMNADATPRAAGRALRNLVALLKDGGEIAPGSLTFELAGVQTERRILFRKADGSYWLAVWDEVAGARTVTLRLSNTASSIRVYDPLNSTTPVQTVSNTRTISVSINDRPMLIRVALGTTAASAADVPTVEKTDSAQLAAMAPAPEVPAAAAETLTADAAAIAQPAEAAEASTDANPAVNAPPAPSTGVTRVASAARTAFFARAAGNSGGVETPTTTTASARSMVETERVDMFMPDARAAETTVADTTSTLDTPAGTSPPATPEADSTTNMEEAESSSSFGASSEEMPTTDAFEGASSVSTSSSEVSMDAAASDTSEAPTSTSEPSIEAADPSNTDAKDAGPDARWDVAATDQANADVPAPEPTPPEELIPEPSPEVATDTSDASADPFATGEPPLDAFSEVAAADAPEPAPTAPEPTAADAMAGPGIVMADGSNTTVAAAQNTTTIYVRGTGNTVNAGPATTLVQALRGQNSINGSSGTATFEIGGAGNKVNVGSGTTSINDNGRENVITFSNVGGGRTEIYGPIFGHGTKLNLAPLLANTQWDGKTESLGNFLKLDTSGGASEISVIPSGLADGVGYPVVTLHQTVTFEEFLANAILTKAGTQQPLIASYASNTTINAAAGTKEIKVYGTGNTINGHATAESSDAYTIEAKAGGNTINTGAGKAVALVAGVNNKINLGAGNAEIKDNGRYSTITLAKAGGGAAFIHGNIFDHGTRLNLKALLADTAWDGDTAALDRFLKVVNAADASVLMVIPTGQDNGTSYVAAKFYTYPALTLARVLTSAII